MGAFCGKILVYEKTTREIPLLPGANQAFWQTPQAVYYLQKDLESLAKEKRQKKIQSIHGFFYPLS